MLRSVLCVGQKCRSFVPLLVPAHFSLIQVLLCHVDLSHQFRVGFLGIVELQDTQSQSSQEVCAQRDDSPEGQNGNDLDLDFGWEDGRNRRVWCQQRQRK